MFSVVNVRDVVGHVTTKSGEQYDIDFSSVYNVNNRLLQRSRMMPTSKALCRVANLIQEHRLYVTPLSESRLYGKLFVSWLRLNQSREDRDLSKIPLPDRKIAVLESNRNYSESKKQKLDISEIHLEVLAHSFDSGSLIVHRNNLGPKVVWSATGCEAVQ